MLKKPPQEEGGSADRRAQAERSEHPKEEGGSADRRAQAERPEHSKDTVRLPAPAARLAEALQGWYRRSARRLPWRGSRDPYAIWVSEVMLQQTQVATVLGYYARFLEAFPTVEALAKAELPDVLSLWSGLGYYRRARHLHAAARRIAALDGFPDTVAGLRALPGFGPYTAAAVASIAFDRPEPAIDGNAVRVYARLCGLRATRARSERTLRELVRPLVAIAPSELNQAVMDLGATICGPGEPACLLCPWQGPCRARRLGAQREIPLPVRRPARRTLHWVAAALRDPRGRLLFARRPERGLFGGLWELPGGELPAGAAPGEALARLLRNGLGLAACVGAPLGEISQQLTHRDLTISAFAAQARGRPKLPEGGYLEARFVGPDEARELGLSSATRKLLAAIAPTGALALRDAARPSSGAARRAVRR